MGEYRARSVRILHAGADSFELPEKPEQGITGIKRNVSIPLRWPRKET